MLALYICFFSLICLCIVVAMPSIPVVASVRGKKYDVEAETVQEFIEKVEALAGVDGQQSVLFRGKVSQDCF